MWNIRLIPQRGDAFDLQLYKGRRVYTVEEILSVRKKVYEDIHYECELHIEKPVSDVTFF